MPAVSLRRLVMVALTAAMLVSGCAAPDTEADIVAAEATMQPADRVDLTVYYRHGRGADAYLTPVVREAPVDADLPRRAIELLLAGPAPDDPEDLAPPLPPATRVLDVAVAEGTATVDLSREVLTRAGGVGRAPEHEALALAAVANTLTEFPNITRVVLTVEGATPRRLWGTWPLPEVLVRDDSVVDPRKPGDVVPDAESFSAAPQRLGVSQSRPPVVASVAIKPRTTYLRVTVEVTQPDGSPLTGPVPPTTARRVGDDIVVAVRAPAGEVDAGDLSESYEDPAFPAARTEVRSDPDAVVVTVTPDSKRDFWLHTLGEPARVVLDIRR